MKNIKLFEDFINEANEEIKAQETCKSAIFQVQKEINSLYGDMQKKGYLDSFKTKVEVWNRGYQIVQQFKNTNLWKQDGTIPEDKVLIASRVIGSGQLFLQPSTFFEDYFEEGKNANLEGKVFTFKEEKQSYEETYPRFPIKTKSDIPKAGKEYVDIIKSQIADIRKMLDI